MLNDYWILFKLQFYDRNSPLRAIILYLTFEKVSSLPAKLGNGIRNCKILLGS